MTCYEYMRQHKKCEDNLDRCKARCCKYLAQTLSILTTKDKIEYYKLHGAIIKKHKNGYVMLLPVSCQKLGSNNKCQIYGNRPRTCREAYIKNKRTNVFMPHCIYEPEKDSIIFEEGDFIMEKKGDNNMAKKRVEICEGKYLLRHTEHWKNIQVMIEEEDPNYEPISLAMMMSSFPGGDEYAILFKKVE